MRTIDRIAQVLVGVLCAIVLAAIVIVDARTHATVQEAVSRSLKQRALEHQELLEKIETVRATCENRP